MPASHSEPGAEVPMGRQASNNFVRYLDRLHAGLRMGAAVHELTDAPMLPCYSPDLPQCQNTVVMAEASWNPREPVAAVETWWWLACCAVQHKTEHDQNPGPSRRIRKHCPHCVPDRLTLRQGQLLEGKDSRWMPEDAGVGALRLCGITGMSSAEVAGRIAPCRGASRRKSDRDRK